MHVVIPGKRWRNRFCKSDDTQQLGEYDSPDSKNKEIRIRDDLKSRQKLDTLTHEIRYDADGGQSEQFVADEGTQPAAILWQLDLRWRDDL